MANRENRDLRRWVTFWSFIDKEGTRYRHQVHLDQTRTDQATSKKRAKLGGRNLWRVRTEIYENYPPYYGVSISVSEAHGRAMRELSKDWTNIEEGQSLYPPEYKNGFLGLTDATASDEPQLDDKNGQCAETVREAHAGAR